MKMAMVACRFIGRSNFSSALRSQNTVFYSKYSRKVPSKKVSRSVKVSELISHAIDDFEDVAFVPYRLLQGYRLGRCFTKSSIEIEPVDGQIRHKGMQKYISVQAAEGFHSIFKNGFKQLQKTVSASNPDAEWFTDEEWSYENSLEDSIYALKAGFLGKIGFHEKCLQEMRSIPWSIQEPELFVAAILANHLFSKMTMSSFFIADDYPKKDSNCPCSRCRDTIQYIYDNSGIGSELLWYGKPDIVVFTSNGETNIIAIPQTNEDEWEDKESMNELDFEEKQIIEVKKKSQTLRYPRNVSQFVAQAITFSYYQKAFQVRRGENTNLVSLIPLIATSGNFFDIYLYDCENDILLINADQIPLWNESTNVEFPEPTLNLSSVIMIWMVLNHLIIKPCLSNETVNRLKQSCGLGLSLELQKGIEKTVKMKKTFYPLQSLGNETILPTFNQR